MLTPELKSLCQRGDILFGMLVHKSTHKNLSVSIFPGSDVLMISYTVCLPFTQDSLPIGRESLSGSPGGDPV